MPFYYYAPSDNSDEGNTSASVSDAWSEEDDNNEKSHISREAQEAAIQEQFKEAVEALRLSNQQKSLRILTDIFLSPTMQEFYVENWRDFNWTAAVDKSQRALSNMAKVYFSVCLGLAGLVENSVTFYMQALSVYPKLTDAWFTCGKEASKTGDWTTGAFCFERCGDEFRAYEALLLLHYINDELHKCVYYLEKILERCKDHHLAHVISGEISRRDSSLKETIVRIRGFQPVQVPNRVREEVLKKINKFRASQSEPKQDDLMELITASKRLYAPLELVLQRDASMETIGRALCDIFLRIETFSSLADQSILVKEFVHVDERPPSRSSDMTVDATVASDADALECDDLTQLAEERAVLNAMLDSVCADFEHDEEAKRRRLQKKKSAQQRKISQPVAKLSSRGWEAGDTLPNTDDELTCRRSTRFVEDVDMSFTDDVSDKVKTFLSHMSIDNDSVEKMVPFVFASSSEAGFNVFVNEFTVSAAPLPSFEPLVGRLLATYCPDKTTTIEKLLADFLEFCASDKGECDGSVFSEEQARTYRNVYTCWCRAFTNNVFAVLSSAELSIHILAAELGSTLAFHILRMHFGSPMKYVESEKFISRSLEAKTLRGLFNRYLWLLCDADAATLGFVADAPELVVFRFTGLTLLAQTLNADERICVRMAQSGRTGSSDRMYTGLSDVCSMLYDEARRLYAKQVDQLQKMENYEELFDVLLNHYNFSQDDEVTMLGRIFLLIKCAAKTNRFDVALSSILAVLQRISNKAFKSIEISKRALRRCATAFDDVELASVDERTLCAFGKTLAETLILSDNSLIQDSVDVWTMCYRIAKHREDLSVEALSVLYSDANDNSFPTRTLTVLSQAHDVIGRQHKCWKKHGALLRLFLEEMHYVMSNPTVKELFERFASATVMMKRNISLEAFQCLVCVFGEPLAKIRNHYDDHGNIARFDWECDWTLAEIALPLIMPHVLPEFSSLEKINNYFAEVITRVFPFVLDVSAEALERLKCFVSNPPEMELREVYDDDGLTSFFSEDYVVDGTDDPRTILYGNERTAVSLADDDNGERRRLDIAAKCLYAMAIYHYRNNNNKDALRMARACLAISGPFLDDSLQSSTWFIYARCVTNDYSMMQDAQLLENVDEFLLPFKMTIFLKNDSCDAHLDVATIIYQLRTRMKRFTKRSVATEKHKCIYNRKIAGMIPKCRTHFELARRYGDSDAEIPWLSAYFLAKIAEKLGDPPEKIFKLYYDCVIAMEKEGYQYPQKINRAKQTNFEPLEIHYKVHTYAYKQLEMIRVELARVQEGAGLTGKVLAGLKSLYANTRRFAFQAVEQKGVSKPEFYNQNDADLLSDLGIGQLASTEVFEMDDAAVCEAVARLMTDLVDYTELTRSVAELCEQGFETVLAKFPHYKSCYRLAESQFKRGEYRKCANTLFHRLFFNAKKRLTMCSNIFENVVEISRADIERSGSFPYHIHKIVDLAVVSSFRSRDIERLMTILSSLMTLKNKENAPDVLDEATVAVLRQKSATGAISLMAGLKTTQALSQAAFQLSDIIRKMQKENIAETETKLLEEAHRQLTQKRLTLEQQQRIAANEHYYSQLVRPLGSPANFPSPATATKRPATDVLAATPPSARNQVIGSSPTVPKHPRLFTPSQTVVPQAKVAAVVPTTSAASSFQSLDDNISLANSKAFAAVFDVQMQRLQMPIAERQRLFAELQKAAARTDPSTQKVLIMKFMEKMCSMTPAVSQATSIQKQLQPLKSSTANISVAQQLLRHLPSVNSTAHMMPLPVENFFSQQPKKSSPSVHSPSQSSIKPVINSPVQQPLKQTANLSGQPSNAKKPCDQFSNQLPMKSISNVAAISGRVSTTTSNSAQTAATSATSTAKTSANQMPQFSKQVEMMLQAAKARITSSIMAAPKPTQPLQQQSVQSDPTFTTHMPASPIAQATQQQSKFVKQTPPALSKQQPVHQLAQPLLSHLQSTSLKVAPNVTTSTMTVRQHLEQIAAKTAQLTQQQQLNKSPIIPTTSNNNASPIRSDRPPKNATQTEHELVSKVAASVSEAQHLQLLQLKQQLEALTKQNSYNMTSNKATTTTVNTSRPNGKVPQQPQQQHQKQIFSPVALPGQSTATSPSVQTPVKQLPAASRPMVSSPRNQPNTVTSSTMPMLFNASPQRQQIVNIPNTSSFSLSSLPMNMQLKQTHNTLASHTPSMVNNISHFSTSHVATGREQPKQQLQPIQQVQPHQQQTSKVVPLVQPQQQQRSSLQVPLNASTTSPMTNQQQYLYNLYFTGLQHESERLNKARGPAAVANATWLMNGERHNSSEDDVIVVSQKGPSACRGAQPPSLPINNNSIYTASQAVGNTGAPSRPSQSQQQQLNEWTEQLKKIIAANAASMQPRRQ